VNAFDASVLRFVEPYAGASPDIDAFLVLASQNHLFKGLAVMAVVWGLWFYQQKDLERTRQIIVATLLAALVALLVARVMANSLPFRPRPFDAAAFSSASLEPGAAHAGLDEWSSFPSDHATLFAALVAGVWFASWRVGLPLMVYVLLVILLPRVYLRVHYLTDIIAGAFIGVAIAWAMAAAPVRRVVATPLLRWSDWSPATFYACAFLLTTQIALLFDPVRKAAEFLKRTVLAG